ncbi:MAG: SAM-dependent methyltransferase [Zetaproteobacteria bacterium CG_4_9_14_3_um_filter_53_7]|nr:MAG: SAM-dependent methyltransferase [Zetaproteobacteria bacterium CG_4_9_14_3_um_filter_53_7]
MSEHQQLERMLRNHIIEAGGFLPFDRFMQAALYEPNLGYYESKTIFGEQGDFITAPELGPWLSLGYADLIFWSWQQLGEPQNWTLLEQGTGSGKLLASVLDILAQFTMAPPTAVISVERSAQLQERQSDLFAERGMSVRICSTLNEIEPAENVIVYSNELPDAFPVRCFHRKNGAFFEHGVGLDENSFCWQDSQQPISEPPQIAGALVDSWPDDYVSEWNPALKQWQQQLSHIVKSGFVFTVDYGYSQQEYYRQARVEGTLLAHIAQQAVEDVLSEPGSRDITAHVDFTALVQAGTVVDLRPVCWMSQGAWLAQSPSVQSFVQSLAAQQDALSMHLMAHAKRVLMPFGMGEVFKLLVQSKGVESGKPAYLKQFDHLDHLSI